MTSPPKRVSFSETATTHIIPSIEDGEDLRSVLYYSSADIRRFRIFDQYRKERVLVKGLTKMLQRAHGGGAGGGCKIDINDFSKLSISDAQSALQTTTF